MSVSATRDTINDVFRMESARLIASLVRIVRDVGLAEELAQDALLAALEQWPEQGIPDKPAAWLMAVAKHRALNALRHGKLLERKHDELGREVAALRDLAASEIEAAIDEPFGDDLLRLMFTACHPVLSTEARVALTLRLLGGLSTEEIARAFLVPEATIAQRIVRAKRTLKDANVPFEVPARSELSDRLSSVLEVIYLIFNEGYAASAGDDVLRPALCDDALRLGRVLAGLAPEEPEVYGLVALMELHASRAATRTDSSGEPVLLLDQPRGRWDQLLIRRGFAALARVEALGGMHGRYALQAAISACHASARAPEETDWARIAELYGVLGQQIPSPIVELNRAVAVAMAQGPAAGLAIIDQLRDQATLKDYYLLPSARADLLEKLGRLEEARVEFERAADLTQNARQRVQLLARAAKCTKTQTA